MFEIGRHKNPTGHGRGMIERASKRMARMGMARKPEDLTMNAMPMNKADGENISVAVTRSPKSQTEAANNRIRDGKEDIIFDQRSVGEEIGIEGKIRRWRRLRRRGRRCAGPTSRSGFRSRRRARPCGARSTRSKESASTPGV